MKLFALLNKDRGSGLAVNALAQMSLGLGHRLNGYPDVHIYFGTTAQVRQFRTLAAEIATANLASSVYSDFPHTMEGGDMTTLLDTVVSTPEADVTYFASCIVAPEIDPRLLELVGSCSQLAGYKPYVSAKAASLKDAIKVADVALADMNTMKTTTLMNKLPLAQMINAVVLANLDVGGKAPQDMLHLLAVGRLTHISCNTHPILKSENSAKHSAMALAAGRTSGLYCSTHTANSQPLVSVTFGVRSHVEEVILRKNTRAFDASFEKEGLVAAGCGPAAPAPEGSGSMATSAGGIEPGLLAKFSLLASGPVPAPAAEEAATAPALRRE